MKLIEIGAHNKVVKTLNGKPYKIVELSDGPDGLYYSKMDNIIVNKDKKYHTMPGSEMYILTSDEETIDECRTWITEVEEVNNNLYNITKKNFYIMRQVDASNKYTKDELAVLGKILPKSQVVYTTDSPVSIFNDFESASKVGEPLKGYLFRREDIEPLLRNGFENMPFKSLFDVYTLSNSNFIKASLDEELDVPRTFVGNKKTLDKNYNAERFVFCLDYDPFKPWPLFANKSPLIELQFDNMSEDGLPIYKKSYKIVQNMYSEDYRELLERKSMRAFIEIDSNTLDKEFDFFLSELYNLRNVKNKFFAFHNMINDYYAKVYESDFKTSKINEKRYLDLVQSKYERACKLFGIKPFINNNVNAFDEKIVEQDELKLDDIVSGIHEFQNYHKPSLEGKQSKGEYLVEAPDLIKNIKQTTI